MAKKKVAFVCIHNSCRSQMAEGYAKSLGADVMDAYSAGTEEYPEVKPNAVKAMTMDGVDMSGHRPKLLDEIPKELDYLITMGCGVECPFVPAGHINISSVPSRNATRALIRTRLPATSSRTFPRGSSGTSRASRPGAGFDSIAAVLAGAS